MEEDDRHPPDLRRLVDALVAGARETQEAVRRELARESLGERLTKGARDFFHRIGPFIAALYEWFEGEFERAMPSNWEHLTVPQIFAPESS